MCISVLWGLFFARISARWKAIFLAFCLSAAAAEKPWLEIRSPSFVVFSNAGEKQARKVADQFEKIRFVFQRGLKVRVDPGKPVLIFAVKDENSLKQLLPEFWETKGHMHPAGIFQPGTEKHYVALRVDVQGPNPYHAVYHEYNHMLLNLNFRSLPLWLNEGLAEFYGHTVIGEKEVETGQPSAQHVILLRETRLLPLEALFSANHSSPFYNEANLASVFYAQSWAVTHYFMLGERGANRKQLSEFLNLLEKEVPVNEAAQRAFGDLKTLEQKLKQYVSQYQFYSLKWNPPQEIQEAVFQARELSPAETAEVRGEFLLRTGRPKEARGLLEEALRLDPKLAQAHESMGFLLFREGQGSEAARFFEQAVQLDSRSYLAHYLHALLKMRDEKGEPPAEVEASLRKAVELNAQFAPGYGALANLYARRREKLEEALALARRAAQLEPGEASYHRGVAEILLRMGRVEEATKLADRLLAEAKSPEDRTAATALADRARKFQQYAEEKKRNEERMAVAAAEKKRYEEELAAARERERQRRASEPPGPARQDPAKQEEEARPTLKHRDPVPGQRSVADGVIQAVRCKPPSLMEVTLEVVGSTVVLHSKDLRRVEYFSSDWEPPDNFDACAHLKGLRVRVVYTVVPGTAYAGEIVSVEVKGARP